MLPISVHSQTPTVPFDPVSAIFNPHKIPKLPYVYFHLFKGGYLKVKQLEDTVIIILNDHA